MSQRVCRSAKGGKIKMNTCGGVRVQWNFSCCYGTMKEQMVVRAERKKNWMYERISIYSVERYRSASN